MEAYRKEIIKLVGKIQDEKFLRQIYTIIMRHIKNITTNGD